MKLRFSFVYLFLAGVFLLGSKAQANLGGGIETIEKDRSEFSGERREEAENHEAYAIHQIVNHNTVIREYVSQETGKVFAISWAGRAQPPLQGLLGNYSKDLKKILDAPQRRLFRSAHRVLSNKNLILERSGHLGSMSGKAFVPALAPANVGINEVK
jgi:Protein of unknown function (DUF2844)